MDRLVIEGGVPLSGTVQVSGSKNAALPILFATLLTPEKIKLENIPAVADIYTTVKLLRELGAGVEPSFEQRFVEVQADQVQSIQASYDLVRTMRASVLVLGPLLARFGHARVSLPGGCSIGARPVNLHLAALEKMGATIDLEQGYIDAQTNKLHGAEITFDKVSVGATENIIMAATLAEGTTVLHSAAQEPEIVDLVRFLRKLGAKIEGEGSQTITIKGVQRLGMGPKQDIATQGVGGQATDSIIVHKIIPDRIEAGTYLVAAAITRGQIHLPGVPYELLGAVIEKLKDSGVKIEMHTNESISLECQTLPQAVDISTMPFPGFPTDMQAQFMALMATSNGTSVIHESIFENRFMHVAELCRLGAKISIKDHTAVIRGNGQNAFTGATVMATDLRASASLVLAGLAAQGKTIVRRVYHLDRGYEHMEEKLRTLGARIWREKD